MVLCRMPAQKRLTIRATVNLDEGEALRVEVTGDVGDPSDAEDLLRFLDGVLARTGRDNRHVATKIDQYRHRVLGTACTSSETFVQISEDDQSE